MEKDNLKKLRDDPKNYKFIFYYCPEDPRVIVPRRKIFAGWGWTINFAHPQAYQTLFTSILAAVVPGLISIFILIQLTEKNIISSTVATIIQAVVMLLTVICIMISCRRYCQRFE